MCPSGVDFFLNLDCFVLKTFMRVGEGKKNGKRANPKIFKSPLTTYIMFKPIKIVLSLLNSTQISSFDLRIWF